MTLASLHTNYILCLVYEYNKFFIFNCIYIMCLRLVVEVNHGGFRISQSGMRKNCFIPLPACLPFLLCCPFLYNPISPLLPSSSPFSPIPPFPLFPTLFSLPMSFWPFLIPSEPFCSTLSLTCFHLHTLLLFNKGLGYNPGHLKKNLDALSAF